MEKHEQFYREYSEVLGQYIQVLKEAEANFRAQGDQAAAVQEKVKANVADIFQKMFQLSYQNVYVKRQNPNFAQYEEKYSALHERLRAAYLDFFVKIPGPWQEKAEKDLRFGRTAEYATEQAKLAVADELKQLFQSQYSRIWGE